MAMGMYARDGSKSEQTRCSCGDYLELVKNLQSCFQLLAMC